VPATVPRIVDVRRIGAKGDDKIETSSKLLSRVSQIGRMCQHDQPLFYGSMMGWTQLGVTELHNFHVTYTNENEFNLDDIQQHNIEFVRMIIGLYLK
jgi:hypothetical protein